MNKKSKDLLDILLQHFDDYPKETGHARRAASKYLWDYFMKLLFAIGTQYCKYNKESLRIAHLKTRWNQIKGPLSIIEKTDKWNKLIKNMNTIREKVEHDDYFYPELNELEDIRKKASLFKEWIIQIGRRYYQSSKSFTLADFFKRKMDFYSIQAEIILSKYGKEVPPYIAEQIHPPKIVNDQYLKISKLKKINNKRYNEILDMDDINQSDLESLVNLIEITSKYNAWEDALINDSICPKCGKKILETTDYSGGSYDEPPDYIHIRIGCDSCDYELMTESYSI